MNSKRAILRLKEVIRHQGEHGPQQQDLIIQRGNETTAVALFWIITEGLDNPEDDATWGESFFRTTPAHGLDYPRNR